MKYKNGLIGFLISTNILAVSQLKGEEQINIPFHLRSWESESYRIREREEIKRWEKELKAYLKSKQKPIFNCLKSTIIPGFWQFSTKNNTKGTLFFLSALSATGGTIYLFTESNKQYEKYKVADNMDDIEKYWNESQKLLEYSEIVAGVGVTIWLINMVDAYRGTNNYNKVLFEKFYYGLSNSDFSPTFGAGRNKLEMGFVYRF